MAAARKRATSAKVGLDLTVRDNLLAVVFDANCFAHGQPDLERLSWFAGRLAEIPVPVWIPEPVAWEWAEHLAGLWSNALTATSAATRTLAKSNLAGFETAFNAAAAVVDAFLTQLRAIPNVVVVPLSAEHAWAGLRDQVLQLKPAKRKGRADERVKTGASDSAWMREVLARAGNDPSRLLFVTEDQDVKTALETWGHKTFFIRPPKDLFATLFTVRVDPGSAARVVLRHLVKQLPLDQGAGVLDIGDVDGLAHAVLQLLPPDVDRVGNVALTRITGVAGIFSVLVEEGTDVTGDSEASGAAVSATKDERTTIPAASGGPSARGLYGQVDRQSPHTVQATVLLLAEAQATTITDTHHGQEITGTYTVRDLLLPTVLLVDLKAGKVVGLQLESTIALDSRDAFDDDADAMYYLAEELNDAIPGLEFPDGWPSEGDPEFERDVNGHHVHVAFHLVDAGEWTVQVTIDDADTAELGCYYDVNARVWDAPESFDMPGAYPITLDVTDSPNPFWAFSWWIINRVYGAGSTAS